MDDYERHSAVENFSNPLHNISSSPSPPQWITHDGKSATHTPTSEPSQYSYARDGPYGRSAELDDSNQLPLHSAAFFGKFSVLSDLLNGLPKSSIDVKDSNGNLVLHYCSEGGDRSLGCLALLLNMKQVNRDAQNDQGRTALHVAAMRGLENTLHALLLSGVKKDIQDAEGNTALHLAGENSHYKCVELLIANGASSSVKNRRGQIPADVMPSPSDNLCVAKSDCCTVS